MTTNALTKKTQNQPKWERSQHLVLLGCGKMGSALVKGWLHQRENFKCISIIEPAGISAELEALDLITCYVSLEQLITQDTTPIDFVVLAVKPQMMLDAIAPFSKITDENIVFLSIAAGLSSQWLREHLNGTKQIVRAMPNTPASIGAGITAIYADVEIPKQKREYCVDLLKAVGEVIMLPNEEMMDAVTALSGSGPAYVFLLAEAMQLAGKKLGIPDELSRKLARETVFGSGMLLTQDPSDSSTLRENVTSKGGTTAAALSVLMEEDCFLNLILTAMQKAEKRSRELGELALPN